MRLIEPREWTAWCARLVQLFHHEEPTVRPPSYIEAEALYDQGLSPREALAKVMADHSASTVLAEEKEVRVYPTCLGIERDEWQYIRGSRTPERVCEVFNIPLEKAIVERLPDDPRWPGEPVWRVKRQQD